MSHPPPVSTEAALLIKLNREDLRLVPEWQGAVQQASLAYDRLEHLLKSQPGSLPRAAPQVPVLHPGFWNFIANPVFQQPGLLAPVEQYLAWVRANMPGPQQHDIQIAEVAFLTQLQGLVNFARRHVGWPVAAPVPVPVTAAPLAEDLADVATVPTGPGLMPLPTGAAPDLADAPTVRNDAGLPGDLADAPTLKPARDVPGDGGALRTPPISVPLAAQPVPFGYLASVDEHLATLPQQGQALQRQVTEMFAIANELRGIMQTLTDRVNDYQTRVAQALHLTATTEGYLREPLGQSRDAMLGNLIGLIAHLRNLWSYPDATNAATESPEWRQLVARERIFYDSIERFLCDHFQVERIPIQVGDPFDGAQMEQRGNPVATTDAARDATVEAVLAPGLQLALPNGAREVRLMALVRLFHATSA
jgi:hypothetical protein